ncbi:ABC transporter permease [Kitasatospora sp. NBC_01539]|uniref:ABC transporter permease n=1 Tax=Kitasatospora sp. NBC_01539 TaxID=2903577 RepID=UPI00386031A3
MTSVNPAAGAAPAGRPAPTAPLDALAARVPALRAFGYWMRRYRRTWRGSVVISVVNPLLFLLAMGAGLGRLVDANQSAQLAGTPYLDFLAPGLLAASAMQNAFVEAAYPVFRATRGQGAYPAAAATPLRPGDILAGHLLFVAFRVLTSGVLFVLVLLAFGVVGPGTGLLLLPPVLLTGLAFAAPLAAWAVGVDRPGRINGSYRFVAMPLYMFSGTFFAVAQLPGWLQAVVGVTPLYQGTELTRSLVLGTAQPGATAAHTAYLLALAAGGTLLARRGYRRRLHR